MKTYTLLKLHRHSEPSYVFKCLSNFCQICIDFEIIYDEIFIAKDYSQEYQIDSIYHKNIFEAKIYYTFEYVL